MAKRKPLTAISQGFSTLLFLAVRFCVGIYYRFPDVGFFLLFCIGSVGFDVFAQV
jgi:hypothetical protein